MNQKKGGVRWRKDSDGHENAFSLTVLVNNAGSNIRKPFLEMTAEDYDQRMQIQPCHELGTQEQPTRLQSSG